MWMQRACSTFCKKDVANLYDKQITASHKLIVAEVKRKNEHRLDCSNLDKPFVAEKHIGAQEKAQGIDRASVLFATNLTKEDLTTNSSKVKALSSRLAQMNS